MHILRGKFLTRQVNLDGLGQNILGDAANEPSIAVHPLDQKLMSIGWRQFDTIASNFRQAGRAYTQNGGVSWKNPGVLDPGVFRTDPVLASDSAGTFFYYSLSTQTGQYECDMFRSFDGGQTWGPPIPAFGGDKAWLTVDRSGGVGEGILHAEWSVFAGCCGNAVFTRSLNGGQSYMNPIGVNTSPIWGTLAVGPTGMLYVAGSDPNDSSIFRVARSLNAQNPGSSPTFPLVANVALGGSQSIGTGPNPGGLLGQVWVATDPVNANLVYLLCSVNPPGPDPLDVRFARSLDGGVNWTPSVRINDDPPGTNAWQWFGTMSVAPGGRIDVVWNDTRASGSADVSQLYYARSIDSGQSWSANEAASPPWNSHLGWPNQDKIGDYYHMISDVSGAHLAWSATFNSEQDVYYTRILP